MKKTSILIADDEPSMRIALAESLMSCGYEVATSEDGAESLRKFQHGSFELVITDIRMPGMSGLEVLRGVKRLSLDTPVIVITAYGTVNTAVEAMKEGAADFIMKPFSLEHLEAVVSRVVARRREENGAAVGNTATKLAAEKTIITCNEKMLDLLSFFGKVEKSKASVLIQGESGTGKELFARYIHGRSTRRNKALVAVNCAAIPHNLLESEMFGYEKGAFTGAIQRKIGKFELADGGTLLLDEISEMDVRLQAKLLRVIQESEVDRVGGKEPVPVDVRIIATTNRNLKECIAAGTFREDLYYRLNVIPVKILSLRERKEDIPDLCEHFLEKYSRLNGIMKPLLSREAVKVLNGYSWPGNVRELENSMERALLLSAGDQIMSHHLQLDREPVGQDNGRDETMIENPLFSKDAEVTTLREMEKKVIYETLDRVGGNRTKASEILGISVRTMRNKLKEYENEE